MNEFSPTCVFFGFTRINCPLKTQPVSPEWPGSKILKSSDSTHWKDLLVLPELLDLPYSTVSSYSLDSPNLPNSTDSKGSSDSWDSSGSSYSTVSQDLPYSPVLPYSPYLPALTGSCNIPN